MGQNISVIDHLLTCRAFKIVKKLLADNPYMCEGNIETLIKKVSDYMLKNTDNINFQRQRGTNINLQVIPSLILIACWIGNRNPERADGKLFKERRSMMKRKKRLPKSIEEGRRIKPIKLARLLALTDSLISLYLPNIKDNQNYDRSTDFYHQIAILEQHQFLNKSVMHKDELGTIKYICNLEQASIRNIAVKQGINIYEHLSKK